MENKEINVNVSFFPQLLAVLFVGLKLTGAVAWSWWWVLSPLWIPVALVLVLALLSGLAH